MDGFMQHSYSNFMNDPLNKLHGVVGPKSREWNEFQKSAKINSLELKYPYNREHSVRLAAIKKGIYNPVLPSLRKIDRDDVLCKLSDEHSRHTTYLDNNIFNNSSIFMNYPQGREPLYNRSLSDLWADEDNKSLKSNSMTNWRKDSGKQRKSIINLEVPYGINKKRSQSQKDTIERFDIMKTYYDTYKGKVHENISS